MVLQFPFELVLLQRPCDLVISQLQKQIQWTRALRRQKITAHSMWNSGIRPFSGRPVTSKSEQSTNKFASSKPVACSATQHKLRLLTGSSSRTYLIVLPPSISSLPRLFCLYAVLFLGQSAGGRSTACAKPQFGLQLRCKHAEEIRPLTPLSWCESVLVPFKVGLMCLPLFIPALVGQLLIVF